MRIPEEPLSQKMEKRERVREWCSMCGIHRECVSMQACEPKWRRVTGGVEMFAGNEMGFESLAMVHTCRILIKPITMHRAYC